MTNPGWLTSESGGILIPHHRPAAARGRPGKQPVPVIHRLSYQSFPVCQSRGRKTGVRLPSLVTIEIRDWVEGGWCFGAVGWRPSRATQEAPRSENVDADRKVSRGSKLSRCSLLTDRSCLDQDAVSRYPAGVNGSLKAAVGARPNFILARAFRSIISSLPKCISLCTKANVERA